MKYLVKKFMVALTSLMLVCSVHTAFAASSPVLDAELKQLKEDFAGDINQIKSAMDRLEWSGISDTGLFDAIAARLQAGYTDSSKIGLESNSWLVKALALSGQDKYRPLLDTIVQAKELKKLTRHTQGALKDLGDFQRWNPVIAANNERAGSPAELKKIRTLNMLHAKDADLSSVGTRRVYHSYTQNVEMVGEVNNLLLSSYASATTDEQIDALAWMCRTLGESGIKQYKPTLERIANDEAANKKLRKYATKYAAVF